MAAATVASRSGSVLILENNAARADLAQGTQGVSVLRNDASNPKALGAAMDRFHPEAVVSAVDSDGINMFICSMVKHFDPAVKTIATVRNSDYLVEGGAPGVDAVIAPRQTSSDRLAKCTLAENVVAFARLHHSDLCVAIFRVDKGSKISGAYVMNLDIGDGTIIAIYRGDEIITSVYASEIHDGDRILIIGTEETIDAFNETVGVDRRVRNIIVVGAGPLGISTATEILKSTARHVVKVIDSDLGRCNLAARAVKGAVVVNGQTSDPVFLRSENVDRADAVVAVSESEEENLLVCMNAVRFGVKKVIAQYTSEEYGDLLRYSGIECVVGYHNVITNETSFNLIGLQSLGDSSYVFDRPGECLVEFTVDDSMPFFNQPVGDVYFPEGIRLVAIIRDGSPIFPDILDRMQAGDRLMFYTAKYNPVAFARVIGRPFTGI